MPATASKPAATPAKSKSSWRRVRFDEMAENIGDQADNPAEAGVERDVALEQNSTRSR